MDTDQAPSKNSKNSGKSFEQICEENDFRGELLSTTAHSLRTSLSAIKWTLQMFLDKDFGEINPEQENMLKKTFENNDRMISIVNDMIKVNKSMDHTQNTENESVDVVELLESLAFDFNAESFKNGVSIVFNKPQTDCFIKSNTEKLRLIFSNLIENAIKYMTECAMAARGWSVLAWDPSQGRLMQFNSDAHNQGGVWGCLPVIVLDVYEHAYFIDYGSDRKSYIEAYWKNFNWAVAEELYKKVRGIVL